MVKLKVDYYIYHYCLNENLPKEHPDFCFNCWIDEAHGGSNSCGQQNWKYCSDCQDSGFDKVNMDNYEIGRQKHLDMVEHLEKYTKATRDIVNRRAVKFLNRHTEADLEVIFNKFYPNVKMVKGLYK